jgi:type VI secretion system VgrG family protein
MASCGAQAAGAGPLWLRSSVVPPMRGSGDRMLNQSGVAATKASCIDTPMTRLALTIDGIDPASIVAFALDGEEALSTLYRFEVSCVATGTARLTPAIVGSGAQIEMAADDRPDGRIVYGLVSELSVEDPALSGEPVYRVVVTPRLARLSIGRYAQLYGITNPVSVTDLINAATGGRLHRDAAVTVTEADPVPSEVRTRYAYPQRDHVAQYEETDLAFISRLAERYGLFYFFEPNPTRPAETVVFADDNVFVHWIGDDHDLTWRPWAPGVGDFPQRAVTSLRQITKPLPRTAWVRDFDDMLASRPVVQSAPVDPNGVGDWTEFEHQFLTDAEGALLARVRAEMLACHGTRYAGRATADIMTPGRLFALDGHPYDGWDGAYLIVSIRHRLRIADLAVTVAPPADSWFGYENHFVAIAHDVPFRPDLVTRWPQVDGLTTGIVEGPPGAVEPYLDDKGRYRVRLTADLADSAEGSATRWIRKAEPYAGGSNGMHFPLPPGTTVVIACINGDPDRPVIVGALPHSMQASVVGSAENWVNRIVSRTGVTLTLGDRRLLPSGAAGSSAG